MVYIKNFGGRMVCGILCKCYAYLIVAHDRFWCFLHVSHIRQKLPKPNCQPQTPTLKRRNPGESLGFTYKQVMSLSHPQGGGISQHYSIINNSQLCLIDMRLKY